MRRDDEDEDGVLRRRDGLDGKVYVCFKGLELEANMPRIFAALRATKKIVTGTAPNPQDEDLKGEAVLCGLAYQRLLTELACWELVRKGELMLSLTPGWMHGDQHRQVQFLTIDKKPVVIDTDLH